MKVDREELTGKAEKGKRKEKEGKLRLVAEKFLFAKQKKRCALLTVLASNHHKWRHTKKFGSSCCASCHLSSVNPTVSFSPYLKMKMKRMRRAKKTATLSMVRSMITSWRRRAGMKRTC